MTFNVIQLNARLDKCLSPKLSFVISQVNELLSFVLISRGVM